MTTVTFDTHKFIKTLEAAGMPEAQAEAISVAVRESHESVDVATSADLRELELRVDAKLDRIDAKMDKQFAEVDTRFAEVNGKLALHGWMLGIITAGIAALVLKAFF